MSLFGKDISKNICTLITFADGSPPKVLASLKESNLPFGVHFTFNNSALFVDNRKDSSNYNDLSSKFWDIGISSFERFFAHVWKLETKNLSLTKSVLDERTHLRTIINNILPQVNEGLIEISKLKKEEEVVKTNKNAIQDNKNFEYTVEEIKQVLVDLEPGIHVTNCLTCNITCHYPCNIPNDEDKRECGAINQMTGKCESCPGECDWTVHKNHRYYIKNVKENVTKTSADMKRRFEEATKNTFTIEQFIQSTKNAILNTFKKLSVMMDKVNECRSKLQEIAITNDPFTSEEYIDLMIETEKNEHDQGYLDRIKTLEELKKLSRVDKEYQNFNEQCMEAMYRLTESK